jgi:hypothetical protein
MATNKSGRTKRGRNPHVNNTLNKIIECLRSSGQSLTLDEIEQRAKITLRQPEDLVTIMRDNPKISYDPNLDRYSLQNKYTITDRASFHEYLKKSPQGLPNNQDLWDCYKGIEKDIEELKKQERVRVIRNDEKKHDVMFYRNPDDPVERYSKETTMEQFMKVLWAEIPFTDADTRAEAMDETVKKRKR